MLTDSVSVSVHVHLRSKPLLNRILEKALISAFFIVFNLACQSQPAANQCPKLEEIAKNKWNVSTVKWIVDGDTLHTEQGEKLRLLHINTPEINPNSKKPAEAYSIAAKERLIALAGKGQTIYWLSDNRLKDKYGRHLALVFNHTKEFVNARLVADGFAHALVLPPNQKYWQCIKTAELEAARFQRGIWSKSPKIFKTPKQAKPKQGFQLIGGQISQVKDTRKYRWLILQDTLWVGIPRKQFQFFSNESINLKVGDELRLRGYVYQSHGKNRVKLNHPAMLYQDFPK